MISRILHWLADNGSVPRWMVCVGVVCALLVFVELVVMLSLWLEGRKFEREHGEDAE